MDNVDFQELRLLLGNDETFDRIVKGGLPQASGVTLCTKDDGTKAHMPVVAIAFNVRLPDGTFKVAQATMTLRQLVGFYSAMRGRYGPGGPESHRYPGAESPFIF